MQLSPAAGLAVLAAMAPAPAIACAIALGTGGTLALSADGTRLGSGEGGLSGSFTVLNLLSPAATVTVSAPVLVSAPAGFDVGAAQAEVAYSGTGLLGSVSQAYTGAASSFPVAADLALTVVTLDNRLVSPGGFDAGTYRTRTVVTCS